MENIPSGSKEFSVYTNTNEGLGNTEEHIVGNDIGEEGVNYDSEDTNPKKNLKRTAMRIGAAVGGGLLLGSLPGSTVDANSVKLAEQNNSEENKPSITEQYHVEIPDKSESSPEFVIDKTGGSGLDGDGFPIEKEVVIEAEEIREIDEIIDITKWEGYELESIENISTAKYLPSKEAFEKGLATPLYIIPLYEDGQVNTESKVLKYFFAPDTVTSFEISKKYTVINPNGDELIFGGPEDVQEKTFNGEFLVLMSVTRKDGQNIDFLSVQKEGEKSDSLQNSLDRGIFSEYHAGYTIDLSNWSKNLILNNHVEVQNNEEIVGIYDPDFFCVGSKYDPSETKNFIDLFNRFSVTRVISQEYLNDNPTLFAISNLTKAINSLDLNPVDIKSFNGEYRAWTEKTDPRSFIHYLATEFPDLDIPLGAYGVMIQEEGKYYGFSPQIINEIGMGLTGTVEINVKHFDIVENDPSGGFYSYAEQGSQVKLHGGQFEIKDFEVGDVVLIKNEETNEYPSSNTDYLIIAGKELKADGSVVLVGMQVDRYGQRRVSMMGITDKNLHNVLKLKQSENIYFIRSVS